MVFISLNDLNVWTSHAVCIEEVRLLMYWIFILVDKPFAYLLFHTYNWDALDEHVHFLDSEIIH